MLITTRPLLKSYRAILTRQLALAKKEIFLCPGTNFGKDENRERIQEISVQVPEADAYK